jgi:trigger factor
MEFKLEEKKGCVAKYSYSMKWDEIKDEYKSILDEVKKEAELPGFRKGKAPVELVKAKFASPIASQLKEKLMRTVADKISKDEKLQLFASPFADEPELKIGEGFTGIIYFELNPEVPEIECDGLEIEIARRDVTEKQVDDIIESFRQRNATIQTVDEGCIEEGDFCSAKLYKDGEAEGKEVFLHCHKDGGDPFEQALPGKKNGESFELNVSEAGKYAAGTYKVSLEKIIRQALPSLDDDFAVKCGFKSLDELKEESRKQAANVNEEMRKEERNEKLLSSLLAKSDFEVPPTLVENQLRRELDRFVNELHRRRIDPEKANIEWDKLIDSKKPEVERSVRAYFVVNKLIGKHKVEVSDDELDGVVAEIAAKDGAPVDKVKKMLEENHQFEDIKFRIAQEKIFEILANSAKIVLVDTNAKNETGGEHVDTDSR